MRKRRSMFSLLSVIGGVGLVTPFNFPLEIPALQALGAL